MVSEITSRPGSQRSRIQRSRALTWVTCLSLLVSLCGGIMVTSSAGAKSGQKDGQKPKPGRRVSSDLLEKAHGRKSSDTVKVILQLDDAMSDELSALLQSNGIRVRKSFNNLKAHAIDMPANLVETVASFPEVSYVSFDRPTQSMGHLSLTMDMPTRSAHQLYEPQRFGRNGHRYRRHGLGHVSEPRGFQG